MKIGRLALRTLVGGLFVGHGTQKLFGWFEGNGLDATAQGFDAMGLRPGRRNAIIAGAGEAAGGAALVVGYQTPLAAAPIVSAMIMAVKRVHGSNGPWSHKGGYEYNLVLAAAALAVVESGPGPISLDALRGKERQGLIWALVTLGLAAGGVAAVEKLAESKAPASAFGAPAESGAPGTTDPQADDAQAAADEEAMVEEALIEEALITEVLVEEAIDAVISEAAAEAAESAEDDSDEGAGTDAEQPREGNE